MATREKILRKLRCRECDHVEIMDVPFNSAKDGLKCLSCKEQTAEIICMECGEEDWHCESCWNAIVSAGSPD